MVTALLQNGLPDAKVVHIRRLQHRRLVRDYETHRDNHIKLTNNGNANETLVWFSTGTSSPSLLLPTNRPPFMPTANTNSTNAPELNLEISHGGVGTLPAPILNPLRGKQGHVARDKFGTLASEHGEKCAQLIVKIARQSVPDQWRMKAEDQ